MERLTERLQHMNQKLQNLLMQKLGKDARNVITAERARRSRNESGINPKLHTILNEPLGQAKLPNSLAEVGETWGDELGLLNEYREQYATMLAELLVAKERVLTLAKTTENQVGGELRQRIALEISELRRSSIDQCADVGRSRVGETEGKIEDTGGIRDHLA